MRPLKRIDLKQSIKMEIIEGSIIMSEFTNQDFIAFMESFKDGHVIEKNQIHKFRDTLTELSRSDTSQADPLIIHPQEMYGLDWIVKGSKRLHKKPPKTTDALYYRVDGDGNLKLHIIEFKFISKRSYKNKLNILWREICRKVSCGEEDSFYENECFNEYFVSDFKLIKKNFKDPIDVSLQLKPFEAIFVTLPELYKEYCQENNLIEKDFKSYLTQIKKYYWVVIRNDSKSESNLKSVAKHFDKYNKRLEGSIFNKARAKTKKEFYDVLDTEILNDYNGEFAYE